MKKIAAAAFKTKCLALMDEVQSKHETIVITKRGKPVAKLVPVSADKDEIYNFLGGKGAITGDVLPPAIEFWRRSRVRDASTSISLSSLTAGS